MQIRAYYYRNAEPPHSWFYIAHEGMRYEVLALDRKEAVRWFKQWLKMPVEVDWVRRLYP